MKYKITSNDIQQIVGFALSKNLHSVINNYNLEYSHITKNDFKNYVNHVLQVLDSNLSIAGPHRHQVWQQGWNENYIAYQKTKNIADLLPKYYGKSKYVRWQNEIVKPETEFFDFKIQIAFVDAILQHFIDDDIKNIYEFGCGPAIHLLRLRDWNDRINLYGLDWAASSQDIIAAINSETNKKIHSYPFNFFEPNYEIQFQENSLFYTMTALEQTHNNYKEFVEYVITKKPRLCINFEPMQEFLDCNNLIDNLSIKYCEKRNYLNKYYNYLRQLDERGKIKIVYEKRFFSGSEYLEGYSVIVWSIV